MTKEEIINKIKEINDSDDCCNGSFPNLLEIYLGDWEEEYPGIINWVCDRKFEEIISMPIPLNDKGYYKLNLDLSYKMINELINLNSKRLIIHCYFNDYFRDLHFCVACEYITNADLTKIEHFRFASHYNMKINIFDYDNEYIHRLYENINPEIYYTTFEEEGGLQEYFWRYGLSNVKYKPKL